MARTEARRRQLYLEGDERPLDALRTALAAAGWQVDARDEPIPHLLMHDGHRRYAATLGFVRAPRRQEVFGALADAVLRARYIERQTGARGLPLVSLPSATNRMVEALEAYAQTFIDGDAWGVIDGRGLVHLHGPGLSSVRREPDSQRLPEIVPRRANPFTDLGQWMLKVLIGERLSPDLLTVPRQRIDSATDLARAADVSLPSAVRLLAALEARGVLVEGQRLAVHNLEELLEAWGRANARRPHELRARWLLRPSDPIRQLKKRLDRNSGHGLAPAPRICLGLFAAADMLGLGVVRGAPLHVYVERLDPSHLESLGMVLASPGERSDVRLLLPRFPQALFRAAVEREGILVSDVLQCWLDVQDHPLRGKEQAVHIYDRILKPCLLD